MSTAQIINFHQEELINSTTEELISGLDTRALNEIFSGYDNDIVNLLEIFKEETSKALFGQSEQITSNQLYYLPNLTVEVDELLKKLVLNYFILTLLPDFEMNWHHIEWGILYQLNRFLNIIAARGHGKSYFYTKAVPLWHLYRYSKDMGYGLKFSKKGLVITAEYKLGGIMMDEIKGEIEENEKLREKLFPNNSINKKWGSEEIRCKNNSQLYIRSMGSKMRGMHPYWIVCDDILTDNIIASYEQNQKSIKLFHSVIMNLLEPQGQIVVVGTPFLETDLYGDLKKKKGWLVLEYPGIFPDGRLLWANKFSYEILTEKIETQGTLNFTREILVKPISAESTVFPYKYIKRAFEGMEDYKLVNNVNNFPKKFDDVVMGTDFAISASQGADSTSFVVLGIEGNTYWVIHMFIDKGMSYDEQMSKMKQLNQDFRPSRIMIETNQMQKIFYQMAIDEKLPAVEHHTGMDKFSLEKGLPALAVLFETYRIKIPRGDEKSISLSDRLSQELLSYTFEGTKLVSTRGHSDLGMSLWQGTLAAHWRGSFDFSFI